MPKTVALIADMSIADAGIAALLGYAVVFTGLALLMVVVILMGKIMTSRKKAAPAPAAPVPVEASAPDIPPAPGSAGQVKLYNVPDREAAMIMAIVADKMGKPLNELRFLSIKEVESDEV